MPAVQRRNVVGRSGPHGSRVGQSVLVVEGLESTQGMVGAPLAMWASEMMFPRSREE